MPFGMLKCPLTRPPQRRDPCLSGRHTILKIKLPAYSGKPGSARIHVVNKLHAFVGAESKHQLPHAVANPAVPNTSHPWYSSTGMCARMSGMRCLTLFMTSGPSTSATLSLHATNVAPGCACSATCNACQLSAGPFVCRALSGSAEHWCLQDNAPCTTDMSNCANLDVGPIDEFADSVPRVILAPAPQVVQGRHATAGLQEPKIFSQTPAKHACKVQRLCTLRITPSFRQAELQIRC